MHISKHRTHMFLILQKLSRILRSLGLETFANFWRVSVSVSENLVSEKKSRFWFRKIWSQKKIIGFGFRDLVSEEKYWFRFQKIWSRKKVAVLENLVSVSSSINILVSLFSAWRCPTSRRVDRSPESAQS